jgi:hypothetical protein
MLKGMDLFEGEAGSIPVVELVKEEKSEEGGKADEHEEQGKLVCHPSIPSEDIYADEDGTVTKQLNLVMML